MFRLWEMMVLSIRMIVTASSGDTRLISNSIRNQLGFIPKGEAAGGANEIPKRKQLRYGIVWASQGHGISVKKWPRVIRQFYDGRLIV